MNNNSSVIYQDAIVHRTLSIMTNSITQYIPLNVNSDKENSARKIVICALTFSSAQ